MKNNIFKSYAKKILKSQAFVSVLIVFVLSLGIIGTSYSLYMDVDKDTDYQVVEVGDLAISFDNGSNKISLTNMLPTEDSDAIKKTDNIFSFYIYNTGTYKVDYDINLETDSGNQVDSKYISYQICKDNADNCEDIKVLNRGSLIKKEQLDAKKTSSETNPSAYYFLRIWINKDYPTTETEAKTIKLKVVVNARNIKGELSNTSLLSGKILNDDRIKINYDTLNLSNDVDKGETEEKGIYLTPDDYGTSYIFRGKQSYNYVSFADKIWRIVRINGDGSVRMILDSTIGLSTFNADDSVKYDNACIGYMYGTPGSDNYDATHENINDSDVKKVVDTWYENNLKDNYSDYLSDTLFCGDKRVTTLITSLSEGYGDNSTYYVGYDKSRTIGHKTNSGWELYSLKCAVDASNDYSRYTVNKVTLPDGNETNGKLKYPIGLITMDEVIFMGEHNDGIGKTFYSNQEIIDSDKGEWTMTPFRYTGGLSLMFNTVNTINEANVRPVINIKSDVLIASGDGTASNPYKLKLS